MAKREIGLMGYLGEEVVGQWLRWKYPAPEFEIVSQIIPMDVPSVGGGYLDLGVICKGKVLAIYEVKSQDYIPDKGFPINRALRRIWEGEVKPKSYRLQEGKSFLGSQETQAYLVLLIGPNRDFIRKIGKQNVDRIILFQDIWDEYANHLNWEGLLDNIVEDVGKVIKILQNPTTGKMTTREFVALRESLRRGEVFNT